MKIGFIGLGIMGESMCENIIKKHNDKVYCFDIDGQKVKKLASLGAIPCESSVQLIQNCDLVLSMVPKSEHVKAVYAELMPYIEKGKICIDMSTIDPSVSVEIASQVKAKGAQFADAPVVKSKPAAIAGTLGILVGCDEELFPVIEPILRYMGSNIIRMGTNGKGIVMKICHNTLVGQIQNGVNETMNLAVKMGIDIDDYTAAVCAGGGQCFYLDGQHENLKNENWATAFSLENMHKDICICERLSKQADFPMPGMENVKAVYDKAMANGIGKEDFRATYKVVRGDFDA
ncbi:MAG: NAD(P)-dependent oxidoreductase [Acutalibacteraceae bacterium]